MLGLDPRGFACISVNLPELRDRFRATSTSRVLRHADRDYARAGYAPTLAAYAACLELPRQLTDNRPLPGLGREQQSAAERRLHHTSKVQITGPVRHVRRPRTARRRVALQGLPCMRAPLPAP